jgi:hypothetical protein
MISIRHFGQQESISDTLLGFSYAYGAFLFVGAFALATDLLKWPALLNARVEEL